MGCNGPTAATRPLATALLMSALAGSNWQRGGRPSASVGQTNALYGCELGFVDFGHLALIIIAKWDHFKDVVLTQHWLKRRMDEIEKLRLHRAQPNATSK